MKLPDLKEQLGFKVAEMRGLVESAEREKRDLGDPEKFRFATLKGETKAIEERIARAETLAEYERRAEATPVSGDPMRRELRHYSVARAIRGHLDGKLVNRRPNGTHHRRAKGDHLAVWGRVDGGRAFRAGAGVGRA